MRINSRGPLLDETTISNLEAQLGYELPKGYREFLAEFNGGIPTPNTIRIERLPGSPTDIQVFFGIGREIESSNIVWNNEYLQDVYADAVQLLPIACDSGGNLFCLVINNRPEASIVYLDAVNGSFEPYSVSPSFRVWISSIDVANQ